MHCLPRELEDRLESWSELDEIMTLEEIIAEMSNPKPGGTQAQP